MPNVDERVVSMRFDNSGFDDNVKTSINTIESLKKSLQFEQSVSNIDNISKALSRIDFSGLQNGIDAIQSRFSTFGIASAKVIEDLVSKAEQLGSKLWDATIGQIKSGGYSRALNIANAQFKLEGMGIDWEQASKDINAAVDGTAYGFDAAANIASQLAGSNIELGEGFGKMATSLKAVSGLAAMTNSSFEEIGSIFATVAGQGKLMSMQLNQIAIRGINAAATLAKYFEVTEEEVRDMVSKGKVSYADFAQAMFDAYAEQATKANETYEGAMSNMKSALSRIGALFYTPYLDAMIGVFNSLRLAINKVKASLEPLAEKVSDLIYLLADISKLKIDHFTDGLNTKFEKVVKIVDKLNILLGKYKQELNEIYNADEILTEAEIEAGKAIWYEGKYGNGEERRKALEAEGLSYKRVQGYVNDMIAQNWEEVKSKEAASQAFYKYGSTISKTVEGMKRAGASDEAIKMEVTARSINDVIMNLVSSLKNIIQAVKNVAKTLKKSFLKSFAFDDITHDVADFSEVILHFTEKLVNLTDENESLEKVFDTIFKGINTIWNVAVIVVSTIGTIFTKGKDVFTSIKDAIVGVKDEISGVNLEIGESSLLYRSFDAIKTIIQNIVDAIKTLKDVLISSFKESSVNEETDMFEVLKNTIKDLAMSGIEKVVEWLERLAAIDFKNLQGFEKIAGFMSNVGETVGRIVSILKSAFNKVLRYIVDEDGNVVLFDNIENAVKKMFDKSQKTVNDTKEFTTRIIGAIVEGIKSVDWPKLFEFSGLLLIAINAMKISGMFSKSVSIMDQVYAATRNIAVGMKNVFAAWKQNLQAKWISTIILMILAVAGSLYLLAQLDEQKLITAGLVIIGVLAVVNLLIKSLSKFMEASANQTTARNNASQNRQQTTAMMQLGIMFIGLGVAIGMISKAVVSIALAEGDVLKGLWMTGTILAALTIVGVLLAITIKKNNITNDQTKAILAMGAFFILLGMAVKKIAKAMLTMTVVLKASSIEDVVAMSAALALLIISFGAVALMAAKVQAKGLLSMGVMFLSMAVAINLLIPALAALSFIKTETIENLLKIMGVFLAFVAISAGASVLGGDMSVSLIAVAAAMMIISKAIDTLASNGSLFKILDLFSEVFLGADWNAVKKLVTVLGTFTACLIILAYVANTFATGFVMISVALLAGAVAFLAIAAAIYIVEEIITKLPALADSLLVLSEKIEEYGPVLKSAFIKIAFIIATVIIFGIGLVQTKLVAKIGLLLISIIGLLGEFGPLVLAFVKALLWSIVDFLPDFVDILATGLLKLILKVLINLATLLANNAGTIAEVIELVLQVIFLVAGKVIMTLLEGLIRSVIVLIPEAIAGIFESFGWIGSDIADSIREWGADIADGTIGLFDNYKIGYDQSIKDINEKADELKKTIDDTNGTASEALDDLNKEVKAAFTKLKKDSEDDTSSGFDIVNSVVGKRFDDLDTKTVSGFDKLLGTTDKKTEGINSSLANNLFNLDDKTKNKINNNSSSLFDGLDATSLLNQFKDGTTSEDALSGLNDISFDFGNAGAEGFTEGFGEGLGEGLENFDFNQYTEGGMDNFLNGISDSEEDFQTEGGNLAQTTVDEFDNYVNDNAEDSGSNFIEGISTGIYKNIGNLEMASRRGATAAKNAFNDTLGIQSPSRVMMESGKYFDFGFAKGIIDYAKSITEATSDAGNDAVNSFNNPLSRINEMISEEVDPTITPMLDLTEIQNGSKTLDGMFGGKSYDLAMNANNANRSFTGTVDTKYDDSNVIFTINSLRNEISELKASMSELQIVMDSGALVGSITSKMDSALGRRSIYKGRSN